MKRTYEQSIQYEVPSSLDKLAGPSHGVIELPRSLYWGAERTVDLSIHSDVQLLYQAVVRTGTAAQQVRWLDRKTLIAIWPDLVLPVRCRSAWQARFPELTA